MQQDIKHKGVKQRVSKHSQIPYLHLCRGPKVVSQSSGATHGPNVVGGSPTGTVADDPLTGADGAGPPTGCASATGTASSGSSAAQGKNAKLMVGARQQQATT